MPQVMYQGRDLTTFHASHLKGLLDPTPRKVAFCVTLDFSELEYHISGSLSGLAERIKIATDALLRKYGEGEIEMVVENTGYYKDSYSLVISLECRRMETEEDAKTRVSLATKALAVKAETLEKKKSCR